LITVFISGESYVDPVVWFGKVQFTDAVVTLPPLSFGSSSPVVVIAGALSTSSA
jgi:hypothetical protein